MDNDKKYFDFFIEPYKLDKNIKDLIFILCTYANDKKEFISLPKIDISLKKLRNNILMKISSDKCTLAGYNPIAINNIGKEAELYINREDMCDTIFKKINQIFIAIEEFLKIRKIEDNWDNKDKTNEVLHMFFRNNFTRYENIMPRLIKYIDKYYTDILHLYKKEKTIINKTITEEQYLNALKYFDFKKSIDEEKHQAAAKIKLDDLKEKQRVKDYIIKQQDLHNQGEKINIINSFEKKEKIVNNITKPDDEYIGNDDHVLIVEKCKEYLNNLKIELENSPNIYDRDIRHVNMIRDQVFNLKKRLTTKEEILLFISEVNKDKLEEEISNSILIDKYKFIINSKSSDASFAITKRVLYSVTSQNISNGNIKQLYFYRSQSEGGIIRLCVSTEKRQYNKGFDYIQATYVCLELQNLINKLDSLHMIPKEDLNNCTTNLVESAEILIKIIGNEYISILKNPTTFTNIDNYGMYNMKYRPVFDPYFYILSECMTGSCFKSANIIDTFISKLKKYQQPLASFENDTIIYKFKKEHNDVIMEGTQNLIDYMEVHKISRFSKQIQIAFDAVSNYMQTFFEQVGPIIKKNDIEYKCRINNNVTFTWTSVYGITIKNKKTNIQYTLDCIDILYNNTSEIQDPVLFTFNGSICRNIISIRLKESEITEYGIYNMYTPAGIYIHKILEYDLQLNFYLQNIIEHRNKNRIIKKDNITYYFIGDMIKLYPLS